jgi:hypothetical protein
VWEIYYEIMDENLWMKKNGLIKLKKNAFSI